MIHVADYFFELLTFYNIDTKNQEINKEASFF
jgi:hypothetical protein